MYCLPEETKCSRERKWAAKFFYMCARKRSHEHGLGLVSEVHSGLALPLLTECQLGRDLNGLKWSLQWGVCCRKGELKRGGQAFRRRDRETGGKRNKDRATEPSLFIDSHVCTNESPSVPLAGASRCVLSSAWLIDMTHLLAAEGC